MQGDVVGSDVTVRGQQVHGDLAGLPTEIAAAVAEAARAVEAIVRATAGHRVGRRRRDGLAGPGPPHHRAADRADAAEGNNWQKDTAHYPEPLTPFGWSIMNACGDQIRECVRRDGPPDPRSRRSLRRR